MQGGGFLLAGRMRSGLPTRKPPTLGRDSVLWYDLCSRPPSQPPTLVMPISAAPPPADAAAPDAGERATSNQAADKAQQAAKVRAFLRALAENDAIVDLIAAELQKTDLL